MAEEAAAAEPSTEEKPAQEEKTAAPPRKSKDSGKSLSTIAEEPTTISSKTDHDDFSLSPTSSTELPVLEEQAKAKVKTPMPLPKLPEPLPHRKKRHTSAVMKPSSREFVVPHDRPRTLSMQERLLSHIQFSGQPLFQTVVGEQPPAKTASILVSGFGLRNLASLQEALQIEEHNKLKQLYRAQERQGRSSSTLTSTSAESTVSVEISRQKVESSSETQTDASIPWECAHKKQLKYLMGLSAADEEGEAGLQELPAVRVTESDEEVSPQLSEAVKQAEKYLRVHKIFEFFQFIIAHLLSSLPENPIEFIIDLLDKCLIYRAGLTDPPLLYDRKHLECLFYLMDKMHTGHIELEQYNTGMRTVGICNFNTKPPLTSDGMITKQDFIEEAYDCLTHHLSDMLKRRWLRSKPPITPPPPPTPQISTTAATSSTGEYPSNRFTRTRLFLDCI